MHCMPCSVSVEGAFDECRAEWLAVGLYLNPVRQFLPLGQQFTASCLRKSICGASAGTALPPAVTRTATYCHTLCDI